MGCLLSSSRRTDSIVSILTSTVATRSRHWRKEDCLPSTYPAWNLAGLADAVVVAESKEKGGSLITAQMALDYDRELFAFPGRPQDDTSRGCNNLIRCQEAHLFTNADELIEVMNWRTKTTAKQPVQTQMIGLMDDLTEPQRELLTKLQEAEEGLHINLLVMETERPYSDVAADLVLLEIQNLVRSLPGGIYRLVR